MKFDSHIKITHAALKVVKGRCPLPKACDASLFDVTRESVFNHPSRSTPAGNYTSFFQTTANWANGLIADRLPTSPSAVFAYLFPRSLGEEVSLVDIAARWTHEAPAGQRYHFMRAPGETHHDAYVNALGFIHFYTERFVNLARAAIWSGRLQPLRQATRAETRNYMAELAFALHSLQDSFSTGHVYRDFGPDAHPAIRRTGTVHGGAPIRELYVYVDQQTHHHGQHADEDYTSGGLDSPLGMAAVESTADLILMAMKSFGSAAGLVGWDAFVQKWLPERIKRGASDHEYRPDSPFVSGAGGGPGSSGPRGSVGAGS